MNYTPINIVAATQTGDYSLKIEFDDKTVQMVDSVSYTHLTLPTN